MLLCIVIDAFYEASALGKASPMVQEEVRCVDVTARVLTTTNLEDCVTSISISLGLHPPHHIPFALLSDHFDYRFCCHHYKFGLKVLPFYERCAASSRKRKKAKDGVAAETRALEMIKLRADVSALPNPLANIRPAEANTVHEALERKRPKHSSVAKLVTKTFISQSTRDEIDKARSKRLTGQEDEADGDLPSASKPKKRSKIGTLLCFPFEAIKAAFKVLTYPIAEW